ncbi:MAG: hypothetical protein M3Z04_10340 [Chloroflexota bacterium]|nr:hypothetical protein [Chloroflexota bacterium]
MVKIEIEVETATPVEMIRALGSIVFNVDSRHYFVLTSVGFVDDDGNNPYWAASLTEHMPNVGEADNE